MASFDDIQSPFDHDVSQGSSTRGTSSARGVVPTGQQRQSRSDLTALQKAEKLYFGPGTSSALLVPQSSVRGSAAPAKRNIFKAKPFQERRTAKVLRELGLDSTGLATREATGDAALAQAEAAADATTKALAKKAGAIPTKWHRVSLNPDEVRGLAPGSQPPIIEYRCAIGGIEKTSPPRRTDAYGTPRRMRRMGESMRSPRSGARSIASPSPRRQKSAAAGSGWMAGFGESPARRTPSRSPSRGAVTPHRAFGSRQASPARLHDPPRGPEAPAWYHPSDAGTHNVLPGTGPVSSFSASMQLLRVAICHLRATDRLPYVIDVQYFPDHAYVCISAERLFKLRAQQQQDVNQPLSHPGSHGAESLVSGAVDVVGRAQAADKMIPVTHLRVYPVLAQRRELHQVSVAVAGERTEQIVTHSFADCRATPSDVVVALAIPSTNAVALHNNPWEPSFLEGCLYQVATGSEADKFETSRQGGGDDDGSESSPREGTGAAMAMPVQHYCGFDASENVLLRPACDGLRGDAFAAHRWQNTATTMAAFNHHFRGLDWRLLAGDLEASMALAAKRQWKLFGQ